jgi:LacI family transcriptional regulator
LESLEEKRVDGLVLCSSRLADKDLRVTLDLHPFAVLVNCHLEGYQVGTILLDDIGGAQVATHHLLQSGHRAIGFLAGPLASYSSAQRSRGYRAALEAAEMRYNPAWVRPCSYRVEGGKIAARELLTDHPEITALFCYNDLVAIGALQACAELGRQTPKDLAIVGFDDIPIAALVTPALTTCRVPRQTLGKQAMQLLLDRIGGCTEECGELVLATELVIRASAP